MAFALNLLFWWEVLTEMGIEQIGQVSHAGLFVYLHAIKWWQITEYFFASLCNNAVALMHGESTVS